MSVIHRAADIVRASRPAATPLREAAEAMCALMEEGYVFVGHRRTCRLCGEDSDPSREVEHSDTCVIGKVRAALAVPALGREEVYLLAGRIWNAARCASTPLTDEDRKEREALFAELLAAVCGPEASHG